MTINLVLSIQLGYDINIKQAPQKVAELGLWESLVGVFCAFDFAHNKTGCSETCHRVSGFIRSDKNQTKQTKFANKTFLFLTIGQKLTAQFLAISEYFY